jgi:hypothetical protein
MGHVVKTSTARSNGTKVDLVDLGPTRGEGEPRWETICVEHGGVCSHDTRKLAESFMAAPEEWCEDCMHGPGTLDGTRQIPQGPQREISAATGGDGTVAADNATTNEEDSMSKTTTAPEKAPSAAAAVAEAKQETAPTTPTVDSDALLKTVTDRAKKALRDVEVHTPKSGGYVTVRVAKTAIAHLSPRKKSLLLEVALAPSSVGGGAEADPRRDGWARLAVTDAKGAERAFNAIEKAAGKLAAQAPAEAAK